MKRMKQDLGSDRADGSMEISICVYLIIFVFLLMVVIEVFAAVVGVVGLNQAADTVAKQIQIEGVINEHTREVFENAVVGNKNIASPALKIIINETGETITQITPELEKKIQLGESYTVLVSGTAGLGGYRMGGEDARRIPIPLTGKTVGVSERYHKDA